MRSNSHTVNMVPAHHICVARMCTCNHRYSASCVTEVRIPDTGLCGVTGPVSVGPVFSERSNESVVTG